MKITKKTETVFELEMDSKELETLEKIKKRYDVSPELFINLSMGHSFMKAENDIDDNDGTRVTDLWD